MREDKTEAIPRRQRTLSDGAGRRRRLLVCRMANGAAANGMNFLQHGAVGPQTRLNYTAALLKFESWLEQREEKVVTDAEIDAAMYNWMENEFMKGNPASSGDGLLSAWMDKCPSFGRHGARKLPKTWRSLQCWQRLSSGRSRKPWVRAVWSGVACRLVEQGQPGELLRLRQCDLVPPLRGPLQNFSVIPAADETGRPTKVRTFNDTLELDGPLARKLVPPCGRPSEAKDRKKPFWPFTYAIFCRFSRKQ